MKMITAIVFAAISVFFISCDQGTATDTSTGNPADESELEKFTITHLADDSEDVFITLGDSSQMELSPGQCVSFSRGDFEYLNVKAGAGAISFSRGLFEYYVNLKIYGEAEPGINNIDLCGGKKDKCTPGNYIIKDIGYPFDDYQLIRGEGPNPDCPETVK